MNDFKTKFIYPIFIFFLLMSLFWAGTFVYFIRRAFQIFQEEKSLTDFLKIFGTGFFIFGYLFLMCGHLTLLLRFSLHITDKRIILKDHLLFTSEDITEIIKGYSRTQFGRRQFTKNTLVLYLKNGRKISLPKFMSWNFKDIEPQFKINNIVLLGDEPYKWKNLIQRRYKFD